MISRLAPWIKENGISKHWHCKQSELEESFEAFSQSWICVKFGPEIESGCHGGAISSQTNCEAMALQTI
jgi:hypothetical protein